ncbi:hypothetical protein C1645_486908 [Glomus cerebriforme]|uniref:Uncharacterized protein n=1 Tax=Glomus cerebriforme TaxID=658196 RepID=A0A397SH13_9GLOM|nr:hypothetical protein C1645_541495 [Glomus cerebriforme]RIA82985.1 hypothetical protein C1645_486908 [Glomus cerebriforme]
MYVFVQKCDKHEPRDLDFYTQNIQEWCKICSEVLYFNQIVNNYEKQKIIKGEKDCKLCGKLIYQKIFSNSSNEIEFRLCSDCYQISSGWVESTLTKKSIPILYLPWWDANGSCIICDHFLEIEPSNYQCQKWCSNCFTIYVGCRYCLTTNIIFGITSKSQCKKCKRILFITIDTKQTIEVCLIPIDIYMYNRDLISNKINNIDENFNPLEIYNLFNIIQILSKLKAEWILYSQLTNFIKIAKGGYGIIYEASWDMWNNRRQYETVNFR